MEKQKYREDFPRISAHPIIRVIKGKKKAPLPKSWANPSEMYAPTNPPELVTAACEENEVFIEGSAGEYVTSETIANKEKARVAIPRKSRIKMGTFSFMK